MQFPPNQALPAKKQRDFADILQGVIAQPEAQECYCTKRNTNLYYWLI
jgi:hypothetical protein